MASTVAHARGGVDELLIERAPIGAEGVDLPPEFRLAFCRLALFGARRVEFLIVLLERVGIGCRRAACRAREETTGGCGMGT